MLRLLLLLFLFSCSSFQINQECFNECPAEESVNILREASPSRGNR